MERGNELVVRGKQLVYYTMLGIKLLLCISTKVI